MLVVGDVMPPAEWRKRLLSGKFCCTADATLGRLIAGSGGRKQKQTVSLSHEDGDSPKADDASVYSVDLKTGGEIITFILLCSL